MIRKCEEEQQDSLSDGQQLGLDISEMKNILSRMPFTRAQNILEILNEENESSQNDSDVDDSENVP